MSNTEKDLTYTLLYHLKNGEVLQEQYTERATAIDQLNNVRNRMRLPNTRDTASKRVLTLEGVHSLQSTIVLPLDSVSYVELRGEVPGVRDLLTDEELQEMEKKLRGY